MIKWLIRLNVAVVFVILIGNGIGWSLYARVQHRLNHDAYVACLDLRNRSVTSAKALAVFEQAALADGNAHTAALWHQYTALLKKQPLPTCKR